MRPYFIELGVVFIAGIIVGEKIADRKKGPSAVKVDVNTEELKKRISEFFLGKES